MKLSVLATQALGFVYKEHKGIDYSKYGSIKLSLEPIFKYAYIIKNVGGGTIISRIMFDYLIRLGYVERTTCERTTCEGGIIRVFLNTKYFRDLANKQEI